MFIGADAAAWQAWGTWATVLVYAVIGFFIWQQVKGIKQQVQETKHQVTEAQKQHEAEMRPYVVVDFDIFRRRPAIFLTITNFGRTMARNIRLEFDPPLRSSMGQPDPEMVYMRHPEVEATSGGVTRESLERVWREKGWEEVPPPRVEDALANIRLLTEGIPTLAPGKEIPILFDSTFGRQGRGYPDAYKVTATYDGEGGRHYEEELLLDLGIYWNIHYVDTRGLHDIYNQVKRIADTLKSWTRLGRLKVSTRDDERRQDEEWMRQYAEQQAANGDQPGDKEGG